MNTVEAAVSAAIAEQAEDGDSAEFWMARYLVLGPLELYSWMDGSLHG